MVHDTWIRDDNMSWNSYLDRVGYNRYDNAHSVYRNLGDILMEEFGGLQGQCMHIDDWDELHGEAYDIMEEGFRKAEGFDRILDFVFGLPLQENYMKILEILKEFREDG